VSIEESMAALLREAEQCRNLHGEITTIKEDLFTVTRNIAKAYGGNPELALPRALADATRDGNMASDALTQAQAFLTALRGAIEEYVISRGY